MQIHNDFPLSEVLWYKIGGKAKYLLEAFTREDVSRTLDFIEKNNIRKVFVVGLGSNIIFSDGYFDGAVIRIVSRSEILLRRTNSTEQTSRTDISIKKDGVVTLFAGDTVGTVIEYLMSHNIIGLEWAGGLPGTVGGGIRGNAGAFGGDMAERLVSAEIVEIHEKSFSTKVLTKEQMHFAYRNSVVKQNKKLVVLGATYQLVHANTKSLEGAKETYYDNIAYRNEKHPLDFPSCGSVFKNIRDKEQVEEVLSLWPDIKDDIEKKWYGKVSMGYLIKRLGFSGKKIGNAQVAEKHCNYILNLGGAKAKDVISLITEIQQKTHETFGFTPEVEVEIVS
ncbi:MAG TPA: UDP-N-acetylmuramate dehydrogenase [Patescibacteria group bacterium]|nr:UDP-N-acetylmuramate dehydrogenase [Patescibacteria group bacterium]